MKGRNRRLFVLPALALLLAGALTLEASAANETGSSEYRDLFKNAFQTQTMPDRYLCPYVPEIPGAPRAPYDSVTQTNLQGRWVNRYKENNGTVDVVDILSVNGDTGRIECYKNGERYVVWNNDGGLYIEDRKDQGVCPALTLEEYDAERDCWTDIGSSELVLQKDAAFELGASGKGSPVLRDLHPPGRRQYLLRRGEPRQLEPGRAGGSLEPVSL